MLGFVNILAWIDPMGNSYPDGGVNWFIDHFCPIIVYIAVTVWTIISIKGLFETGIEKLKLTAWEGLKAYFVYTEDVGSFIVQIICLASYWYWLAGDKGETPIVHATVPLFIVAGEMGVCLLFRMVMIPWAVVAALAIGVALVGHL